MDLIQIGGPPPEPANADDIAIDPVCGMTVERATAPASCEHEGKTYYFCCSHCLTKFKADPAGYIGEGRARVDVARKDPHPGPLPKGEGEGIEVYTCPMHPEVVQDHPGACPKCGMALEPMAPSANEGPDPELSDMQRRLTIGAVLTLPIFCIAMLGMVADWAARGTPQRAFLTELISLSEWLHHHMAAMNWLQLVLATPVVLWCGWPFFVRGWQSIVSRNLNMFTLIALGVGAAYGYSVLATVVPGIFPEGFRVAEDPAWARGLNGGRQHPHPDPLPKGEGKKTRGAVEPYFDSAAVIVVLVLVGQVLELRARTATGAAVRALLNLAPKMARLIRADGHEEDVPVETVGLDDRLRIRPGERIAVDGIVVEGNSAVDESMITGEPLPVDKSAGSHVTAGTMNTSSSLVMRATRVGDDTLLAEIVRMVSHAQRTRAPIEKLVDRVARIFVPTVLVVAALAFVGWALVGPQPRMAHALVQAVAVLIIACPCALGLATPMAIVVGTGKGARGGVLFRDAEALEVLRLVDTLVVDKTGTLTEGRPKLTTIAAAGFSESDLLAMAAGLEKHSEHPLAAAIVRGAAERGVTPADVGDFRSLAGHGVVGRAGDREVAIGNEAFLAERRVDLQVNSDTLTELRSTGKTAVLVAVDGQLAGLLAIADPIKSTAKEAIAELHAAGIRIVMLTGDNRTTAEAVAKALGIDEVIAGVLPAEKREAVRRLRLGTTQSVDNLCSHAERGNKKRVVAMAGDGINDAPALAEADVGIAMGTGTDIAIESAGVTLVKGDLRRIVEAIKLSRRTSAAIRQNLVLAFLYNSLCVPLAALGFVSPMLASAAMSASSLSVILNSLRLRRG